MLLDVLAVESEERNVRGYTLTVIVTYRLSSFT